MMIIQRVFPSHDPAAQKFINSTKNNTYQLKTPNQMYTLSDLENRLYDYLNEESCENKLETHVVLSSFIAYLQIKELEEK